jgi:hypothetical protein
MILIPQVKAADVAKLKCIYFNLVNTLKEIDWYGINCNKSDVLAHIETAFIYLNLLNTECELSSTTDCEIKNFITKTYSFCVFTDTSCVRTISIEEVG